MEMTVNTFFRIVAAFVLSVCVGQVSAAHPPADEPANEGTAPSVVAKSSTLADARDRMMYGDYEAAIESFEALAGEPASSLEAALGLAEARMRIGGYADAIKSLESLNARDSSRWHYQYANACLVVGRYDDAQQHAREAVRLDDDFAGARLLLGQVLETLGRRDDAVEVYRWFDRRIVGGGDLPRDAAWITDTAVGFYRFSVLTGTSVATRTQHVLNEMLQVAYTRIDRGYWPARIAAADLLREKHNNGEEDGSVSDYRAALKVNPNLPEAHVGLGEVALESWGFEEIERRVDVALKINPNYAPAHHLLAKKQLVERRYAESIATARKALAINPNDLTALSLAAAGYACQYDQEGVDRMQAQVAKINPRCALYHRTLADALSGIRQYAASEKHYRQAIEYDPTDVNARTELGMMYMQWGPEDKAREALDAAWALDKYNERTKFTLDLLDSLHKFARHETEHFVIKYDADQDPGLGEYIADHLESVHAAVTGDFDTVLSEKTTIEIFPTHKAFAVRITGKPWIYTVGACTGSVIALAAPRQSAKTMGRYHLARVLKHEFTHTVTLAATQNRIPHWFTEGLAVYQEDAARGYDWAELLADAVRGDRLFTLESIDWGFIRPKRPTDRQMAYAQSEWMVEYMVERFGYDSIQKLLTLYRQNKTQPEALRELFQIDVAEFDRGFSEWARKQVGTWACSFDLSPRGNLSELRKQAESEGATVGALADLAKAELIDADYDRARSAAAKALEKNPDDRTALEVMVSVFAVFAAEEASEAGRRQHEEQAMPYIDRLLKLDADNRAALKLLGAIALRKREWDIAEDAYRRLQRVCPMDPSSWRGLAAIYIDRRDDASALPQLVELARIEQSDPDVARRIAEISRKAGRLGEAAHWFQQAIFIDPFDPALHDELGETHMQAANYASALKEFEMAAKLEPAVVKHFESAALAAIRLNRRDLAEKHAERAKQLNPDSNIGALIGKAPAVVP